MRHFSFYHRETGAVHAQRFATDAHPDRLAAAVAANTPSEHVAVEAVLDHLSQRVDVATGAVADYQPPAPGDDHEWDADAKRWRLTEDAERRRAERAAALAEIAALEAGQARAVREGLLGLLGDRVALERLRAIDKRVTQLREKL